MRNQNRAGFRFAGRGGWLFAMSMVLAGAAFCLLATGAARADLATNLQLHSSMAGTTPYVHAAYWQDATGNAYDGQVNVTAYDDLGNHRTAANFFGSTTRMRVHSGFDTLLDAGTTDFSVSLWYYEVTAEQSNYLLTNGNSSGSQEGGFCLMTQNGQPQIRLNDVAEGDATHLPDTRVTLTAGTGNISGAWHHLVAIFDRTGTVHGTPNQVLLYVDNEKKSFTTLPELLTGPYNIIKKQDATTPAGKDLRIGGRDVDASYDFEGYMDDVAVYRGALSAADVGTLYAASNLGPGTITTPGITPVAIHNFAANLNRSTETLGAVPDDYGSNPGTLREIKQVTDAVRGDVLRVNGCLNSTVSEYVKYVDVLDPMSTSYTAGLWFKLNDSGLPGSDGSQMLMSKGMNGGTANEGWAVFFQKTDTNQGKIVVRANYDGTSNNRLGVCKSLTIGDDQWHYVTLVIDQESGLLKGYLDGQGSGSSGHENGWDFWSVGTDPVVYFGNTFTPGAEFNATDSLALAFQDTNKYPTNGWLDDLAIWSRALSDQEIVDLYNGAVIPSPLPPIPGDTNNNRIIDDVDAAVVAGNWGQQVTQGDYASGDFNNDGWVNAADAAILTANWGYGAAEQGPAVPEPHLLLLVAGGLLAVAGKRQARR